MRVVAEHLGHATAVVTERYSHLHPQYEQALSATLEALFLGPDMADYPASRDDYPSQWVKLAERAP